jgi:thioredoxin-related protein
MKTIFTAAFFLLFSTISFAQESLTWHTDMEKAISISQKEKKPIMLFFTGSDWCGWCIRLQKEVFKTPEFIEWAKANVVLVDVDFPKVNNQSEATKTQNNMLQQQFGVQGYPTCWFVKPEKNKEGKYNLTRLGSQGYLAGGPTTWIGSAITIINSKK